MQFIEIFNQMAQVLTSKQIIVKLIKRFSFAIFIRILNFDSFVLLYEFKEKYFIGYLKKNLLETID